MKFIISLAVLLSSVNTYSHINFNTISELTHTSLKSSSTSILKIDPKIANRKECRDFIGYAQNQMNTAGLIVIQNGMPQIEMYANKANKRTRLKVWSVSKFFTGLMLGAQVKNYGMRLLDKSLYSFGLDRETNPKDKKSDPLTSNLSLWEKVKVRNVWNMSSGFNWCEYRNCRSVDAASIMYGSGYKDPVKYVLSQPLSHEPGSYYRYSAGNYMLLQHTLREIIADEAEYLQAPYETILEPMGVAKEEYAFEVTPTGLFFGGSGLAVNTQTFAKLGQLLLNGGKWDGKEIIPKEFFNEMTRNSEAIKNSPFAVQNWEGPAGGSVWLNDDSSNGDGKDRNGIPSFMTTSPWDMIYAGGNYGQFLLVYPSSNLVVARLGGDSDGSIHWQPFSDRAIKCFDPTALRDFKDSGEPKVAPMTGKNLGFIRLNKERILANSRVQELCSCLFVSGYKSEQECNQIVPMDTDLFLGLSSFDLTGKPHIDFEEKTVTIYKNFTLTKITSSFNKQHPERGCYLNK